MYTSKDLAEAFGLVHRDITKRIKAIIDELAEMSDGMFIDSSFTSRGKTSHCFKITKSGMPLLLQYRMFSSSPSHASLKSKILSDYEIEHQVVVGRASRFEDSFYSMLCDFVGKESVVRQFPVLKYRVDFFIKPCSLFVEFDEEHHLSATAKANDKKRWDEISDEIESITSVKPRLIRVKKGGEVSALSKIAACICREAPDWMIDEKEIEKYNIHICD